MTRNPLGLNIPEQSAPGTNAFPTQGKKVQAWVEALPMANVGETTRRLYTALSELNHTRLEAETRFKVLELIAPSLQQTAESLKRHYVDQSFPLPDKNHKVADLTRALFEQLALGYKSAVTDTVSGAEGRLTPHLLSRALHRATRYTGEAILLVYQIYEAVPEHLWQDLHRLYRFAEQQRLLDTAVREVGADDQRSTLNAIYGQVLLTALADPYHLRQRSIEMVYQAALQWAGRIGLKPFRDDDTTAFFLVDLDSALPPYHRNLDSGNHGSNLRLLETGELVRKLQKELDQPQQGWLKRKQADKAGLTHDLLRYLSLRWGMAPKRGFSRMQRNERVMVTVGLSAIHRALQFGLRPPGPADKLKTAENGLSQRSHYTSIPVPNAGDDRPDVWEMIYWGTGKDGDRQGNENTPGFQAGEGDADATSPLWHVMDMGAGGYRLRRDEQISARVQVGEPVGIREAQAPERGDWQIGVIRWMKWDKKTSLEMGIQMLSPSGLPVAAKPLRPDGSGDFGRALLLPGIPGLRQAPTLLAPAVMFHEGDLIRVQMQGREGRIKLVQTLENTGPISQYRFQTVDFSPNERRKGTDDEDFSGLWSSL